MRFIIDESFDSSSSKSIYVSTRSVVCGQSADAFYQSLGLFLEQGMRERAITTGQNAHQSKAMEDRAAILTSPIL